MRNYDTHLIDATSKRPFNVAFNIQLKFEMTLFIYYNFSYRAPVKNVEKIIFSIV